MSEHQDEQDANPAKRQRIDAEDTASDEESDGRPILPAEMFDLVIARMNVNELLACRSVCKYFKQVVDRIKFRSLVIAESQESTCHPVLQYRKEDYDYRKTVQYKRFSDRFFFVTNEPVYESDALYSADTTAGLRVLVNRFDLSLLRKLFVVEAREGGQALFGLINGLVQLKHLQIDLIDLNCNVRLQLPNLRVLSIAKVKRHGEFAIWLATPSLTHLETSSLNGSKFQFEYREKVTFLQCRNFSHEDLFELENLEVLICEYANNLVRFDLEHRGAMEALNLANFPRLRRVDCARMDRQEAEELGYRCERNAIDFYYCGRRVDDLGQEIGDLLECAESDEFIKLLHVGRMFSAYDRLADSLYFCEGIRYWKYFDTYFPNKLPENFARKFYCVRGVYVARPIEKVEYFLEFLRCFKNLKVLCLDRAALPQDFFDRHSHLFARLHEFSYKDHSKRHQPNEIDFKFILNLRYLEKFFTNQRISMRLLSEAFNTLKHLERFWVEDFLDFKITRKENEFKVLCIDFEQNFPTHQFSSKTEMLKFMEERFPALSASSD